MFLRSAKDSDFNSICEMQRSMIIDVYPNRETSSIEKFYPVCAEWLNSPLYYVFVIEHKSKVIGFCTMQIDDNDGMNSPFLTLFSIYIDKHFRHTNAIKLLFNNCIKLADELGLNLYTFAMPQHAEMCIRSGAIPISYRFERVFNVRAEE